jgi:monoamine oxidase
LGDHRELVYLVNDADVLVIGAGAAGLAAARQLAGRSLRTIVLEARDRFGGRVWWRRLGNAAIPAELGAEFIHGRAPETFALLREAHQASVDLGGESWSYSGEKLEPSHDDFLAAASLFDGARSLDRDESVDDFLRRFPTTEALRRAVAMAREFVIGFDAADPAIASARGIADEWDSGTDSTTARPLGGYGHMMDWLARACAAAGAVTRLSTIVRRIAWRRGAVAVDVASSDGVKTLTARSAIVTLPIGVLRHAGDGAVAFDPALPPVKDAALRKIEMGHAVKVSLAFEDAFWERIDDGRYADLSFVRFAAQPFSGFWTQVPVRSELVSAWAGGPRAQALAGMPPAHVVELALDGFGTVLGVPALAHRAFTDGAVHDWATDPFARGAYSYLAVGAGDARAVFAAPVDDTLFFAGEATASGGQGGTVNGALATGERAAREVADALGAAR